MGSSVNVTLTALLLRLSEAGPSATLSGRAARPYSGRTLDRLLAAGLSPHAVVSLSQLIAYVNFQSRVLAGLRMLRDAQ